MALYTAGNVSTLEILLDSESLADFTTRATMVETMTAHDQQLVDELEAYVESTSAEREECEAQKKEVAELQKTLESKQEELDQGLVNTVIATDGIAIIVNNDSPIEELTSEQVRDIYLGNITDWSELG